MCGVGFTTILKYSFTLLYVDAMEGRKIPIVSCSATVIIISWEESKRLESWQIPSYTFLPSQDYQSGLGEQETKECL
jgi:hypothetical protein